METRRDFLKKSILLSGAVGMSNILPTSIQRALAIDPSGGSTYLDAEHIVILMQENRSFDHCFGSLKGVRGFNDPRTIQLPNGLPVWMQSFDSGNTVLPFRLNIKDTKATWMGSLPHGRTDQVDAWNGGRHDNWLESKRSRNKDYKNMPLTMGYYNREDLPFDYALADAFTVCDHHFCSLMGSTTPNRSYFWSGKIKDQKEDWVKSNIDNRDYSYGRHEWETFPELLEKNSIDWKFYQNDLYCGALMSQEERDWLLNFGCNVLEFWKIYNVKFSSRYVETLKTQIEILQQEIIFDLSRAEYLTDEIRKKLAQKRQKVKTLQEKMEKWSQENFDQLSDMEKQLFKKAFITNKGDEGYRTLTTFKYEDHGEEREVTIPKGDILHQFRKDVKEGNLATVNWLASPKYFSDHPTVPWYGTWYTSEILNILTQNPEIWKKTIFILTFDENDGYFDHIPPFSVPDPRKEKTGMVSANIDAEEEWIRKENEIRAGKKENSYREAPIGLGYRVPMIIASPWSRGGKVCSQIFDHTSTLQFLEHFLNEKYNKNIRLDNISQWRRTVCGDLSSVFTPFEERKDRLPLQDKEAVIKNIHQAQYKQLPNDYHKMSMEEGKKLMRNLSDSLLMPKQEPGTKTSCALPYELYVDGNLSKNKEELSISFAADNEIFGKNAVGAPFVAYAFGDKDDQGVGVRQYAVTAGDHLTDYWPIREFNGKKYEVRIHGPNGFFRVFKGNLNDPEVMVNCVYERENGLKKELTGNIILNIINHSGEEMDLAIKDHGYDEKNNQIIRIGRDSIRIVIKGISGWYDFSLKGLTDIPFEKRYAGKVETGELGTTDPVMGNRTNRS